MLARIGSDQAFPSNRILLMQLGRLLIDLDRTICLALLHEHTCYLKARVQGLVRIGLRCRGHRTIEHASALVCLLGAVVRKRQLREIVWARLNLRLHGDRNPLGSLDRTLRVFSEDLDAHQPQPTLRIRWIGARKLVVGLGSLSVFATPLRSACQTMKGVSRTRPDG